MSNLSREQILKLAKLSKLILTEAEIKKFQKDLNDILNYVERLNSVDDYGLEPTYQVIGLVNQTRPDKVELSQPAKPDELLKLPPKTQSRYIKVGRMV
jgi:aspartyl-tRNA(Asn)/glutamyl-tRNA(Gln) amidotransferase subunit C